MIISIEGYRLPSGFIVREMSVIFDNGNFQHFEFKCPTGYYPTMQDQDTIKYTTRYLNEIHYYDDGLLPYSVVDDILRSLANQTIYVGGHSTFNFITAKLPLTRVIDICKTFEFRYPKILLPSSKCFRQHNNRYCSAAKAEYVQGFLKTLIV